MIRGSGVGVPLPGVPAREWIVVIPVKRAEIGKSRLRIPGVDREPLARAIALDTVEAATACERVAEVIVVTSDEVTATALRVLPRVRLVRDRSEGLTAAIGLGVSAAPDLRPRAVMLGDLPAHSGLKAEAVTILGQRGSRLDVIIGYDGAKNGAFERYRLPLP